MGKNKKKQKTAKKSSVEVIETKPKEWFFNNKINWILLLLVTLPFVYSRKSMEPALSPRFIYESAFLLVYHLYFFGIRGEKYFLSLPKISKYAFILSGGFVIWSLVAVFGATNFEESLYEVSRNALNFVFFFTAIHAFVNDKFNILIFCRWVGIAALVHGVIGLDENFEWGNTNFPGGASPHGLMANRNLFGSAQALAYPFIAYLIYKEKGIWKYISSFILIVLTASIYISITRSAYFSATIVFLIAFIIPLILDRNLWRRSLLFATGSLMGLVFIFGIIEYDKLLNRRPSKKRPKTELTQKNKSQSDSLKRKQKKQEEKRKRLASKKDIGFLAKLGRSGSIKERLVVWQESAGVIKDDPLFGVGPGNWKVDIPKYRIGGIRNDYGKIVRIRPHNIYIQILTENGFPGFLIYYGVWVLVFIMTVQVIRLSKSLERKLLSIMLIGGFFSFAIDGFFSFPLERYEHTLFLFLMMAIAMALYITELRESQDKGSNWTRLLVIPIVGLFAWNIFLGMERHKFEYHMNRAKVFQKRKQNERIIREVEAGKSKWVSLDPNKDPLEIQSAMAYKNLKKYDLAMKEAVKALEYSPNSTRNLNTKGTILTEMKNYDDAIDTYLAALVFAPFYEITLKNLALNYLYSKRYKQCLETLEKIEYEGDEQFEKVEKVAKYRLKKQKQDSIKSANAK